MRRHRCIFPVIAQGLVLLLMAFSCWAAEETDLSSDSTNAVIGAVNDNEAIIGINQASGSLNNQANIRTINLSPPEFLPGKGETNSGARADADTLYVPDAPRQDMIVGSFQNNTGIMGVNQAAGHLNQQSNTLVMGLGKEFALTDTELGTITTSNVVSNPTADRLDAVTDSFAGTQGIVQVNQSAGDLNINGNNIAFAYQEIHLK